MDWLMPRAALAAAVAILVLVATPAVLKAKVATSMPMPLELLEVREQVSTRSVMPDGGVHPLVKLALQGVDACSCTVTNQSLDEAGVIEGAVCVVVAAVLGVPSGVTPSNGVAVSTPE
jgi:hypothetical protein